MAPLWEKSNLGQRLISAPWSRGDISLFVVIRNEAHFRLVESLNSSSRQKRGGSGSSSAECLWLPDDVQWPQTSDGGASDAGASDVTKSVDDCPDGIGVIALRSPAYGYEKRRRNLPPCFLFGRQGAGSRFADVWVGKDKRINRKGFTIGLKSGYWVIRSLGPSLEIHQDTPLRHDTPGLALHPHEVNFVRWNLSSRLPSLHQRYSNHSAADSFMDFEIYCRDAERDRSHYWYLDAPAEEMDVAYSTTTSEITSHQSTQPGHGAGERQERLYAFHHEQMESRTDVPKILALDPWTCKKYVARIYPVALQESLQSRLKLVEKLPMSSQFMQDESLRVQGEEAYLLTSFRLDTFPLRDVPEMATTSSGRRLLWTLLRLVAELHGHGIYHGDICVDTVLVDLSLRFDIGVNAESVFLGGFSEASEDHNKAVDDCFQLFQAVRDFLAETELPPSWLGHQQLDQLWVQASQGRENWTHDVSGICQHLEISLTQSSELWWNIAVKRDVVIRYATEGDISYLDAGDTEEYLKKDSVRCSPHSATAREIAGRYQNASTALAHSKHNQRISLVDYHTFQSHMKFKHHSIIGERLAQEIPDSYIRPQRSLTITLTMPFQVPYHPRYGLVSITQLSRLASHVDHSKLAILDELPKYEVRGHREVQGFFVATTHLDRIADTLELDLVDRSYIGADRDDSLDEYTHPAWHLLVSNESSEIIPMSSETGLVHLADKSTLTFGEFLKQNFPAKGYLDAATAHDPGLLTRPWRPSSVTHSCHGSANDTSSDGAMLFRFSNRGGNPIKNLASPSPSQSRTTEWVDRGTPGRLRSRADIKPTVWS